MNDKKPHRLKAKVEVKSHEETNPDGSVRQVVDDLEIKWVATPLPDRCEVCEHRNKVSPNIPVCCHPDFLAKHEAPYIPFASEEPVRPNWCPLPDRIKLSPETFAQAAKTDEDDLYVIVTPELEETVKEALREAKKKTRCPECGSMLVHSMKGVKCNNCKWEAKKR